MPKGSYTWKATARQRDKANREERTDGVRGYGMREEDDPGTWETHISPRGNRNNGEPVIRPRARHAHASAHAPWQSRRLLQRTSARRR
jgi:hypothetical protein